MKFRIVVHFAGTNCYEAFCDTFSGAHVIAGMIAQCASADSVEVWEGSKLLSRWQ